MRNVPPDADFRNLVGVSYVSAADQVKDFWQFSTMRRHKHEEYLTETASIRLVFERLPVLMDKCLWITCRIDQKGLVLL